MTGMEMVPQRFPDGNVRMVPCRDEPWKEYCRHYRGRTRNRWGQEVVDCEGGDTENPYHGDCVDCARFDLDGNPEVHYRRAVLRYTAWLASFMPYAGRDTGRPSKKRKAERGCNCTYFAAEGSGTVPGFPRGR